MPATMAEFLIYGICFVLFMAVVFYAGYNRGAHVVKTTVEKDLERGKRYIAATHAVRL